MSIPPWTKRDNFSTPAHQRLVDALNGVIFETATGDQEMISTPGGHVIRDRRPVIIDEIIFGKIVAAGPNSEADFADNRYWVKKQELVTPATSTNATTLQDDPSPQSDMVADSSGLPIVSSIVMATNPLVADGHALTVNTPVLLIGFYPLSTASGSRDKRYMLIPFAVPTIVPLVLDHNGGSNGSGTTQPTYTYDLYPFTTTKIGGTTLGAKVGTAQSPMVGRVNGLFAPATLGLGIPATDGGYALLYAWELPGRTHC